MKNTGNLLKRKRSGGLIYNKLNSHIEKKCPADTPPDKSFVPYLIMLLCAVVDASVFINLFESISYENPFMLAIEVAGFLFAFDVVPIYIGIQLRRLQQHLCKERFILWLAFGVCAIAFLMNFTLRTATIDKISPDLSSESTSYFGTVAETSGDGSISSTGVALTIFGIGLPMLTSVGSFFISFPIYNPLQIRKRTLEELLGEKDDEIRRFNAILREYEADDKFAERLFSDDECKYREMQNMIRAKVASYCDYVRQRLKEHLATPAAINAISEERCIDILERLDRELAAFKETENPTLFMASAAPPASYGTAA
ncbi:MAG: DUF4299 domain-containing protein [Clostridia bacterium]|nr:DUF4299 domain-containing protein [Clostridia bacterium]